MKDRNKINDKLISKVCTTLIVREVSMYRTEGSTTEMVTNGNINVDERKF